MPGPRPARLGTSASPAPAAAPDRTGRWQQSRNDRALPSPARMAGANVGGVGCHTPGAGGGGANGMSTDAVSSPSPWRWARTAEASCVPAAMPALLAGPPGIAASVAARSVSSCDCCPGTCAASVSCNAVANAATTNRGPWPSPSARGSEPAHGPSSALRDRLGVCGGRNRLVGDVIPLTRHGGAAVLRAPAVMPTDPQIHRVRSGERGWRRSEPGGDEGKGRNDQRGSSGRSRHHRERWRGIKSW